MRSKTDTLALLDELDRTAAHELEGQDLDFKEWIERSLPDAVAQVVEMAVCMANGQGGTVVFGVKDDVVGRDQAITGVPSEIDSSRLVHEVYSRTDPHLTPVFEEVTVPEGRLLIMQVFPGLPPYTDTAGRGKIRIGTDCMPLTGSLRTSVLVETGASDATAETISGDLGKLISATAVERLRDAASRERAASELLELGDRDLLEALGVLRPSGITRGGLLVAGSSDAIRRHIPNYRWSFLRMKDESNYSDRLDGNDALPVAVETILARIMAENPIATIEYGPFHFEYRTYPEVAIREALLNAFGHADFRLPAPIMVKQYADKLRISNPGGFIGGITPENILHHQPVARNPHLIDVLTRLRLVNRSNLGVARMYTALLVEGKEPPLIEEKGSAVVVTFLRREMSPSFRSFIAEQNEQGNILDIDHLLILRFLLSNQEIDTATAARICQRSESEVREVLNELDMSLGFLERGGTGRGTYWTLRSDLYDQLAGAGMLDRDRRIDWEAAKTRILSVLKQRAERGEQGLSNAEVRQITHFDRHQALRLIKELASEGVQITGHGRGAKYVYQPEGAGEHSERS